MEVLISIVAIVLVFLVLWRLSGTSKKPPGPWGLPIVGYTPFLTKKPHLELQRLAKKYGNVFRIRLGKNDVVVLNDFQTAKDAFSQDLFIGRPPEFGMEASEVTKTSGALLGLPWKEQRRFALHTFRDLGFGKTKMEVLIMEEINVLLKRMEQHSGIPLYLRKLIAPSMSNNIAALMFGRTFEHDDPILHMLTQTMEEATDAAGEIVWTQFFPWMIKILKIFKVGDSDKLSRANVKLKEFIKKEIEVHEDTLNPEFHRDFIDGYLVEIKKRKDEPSFHKEVLQDLVGIFFGAGSETVRLSVEWLAVGMAHYQDVQRRILAEIDEVIGRDRPPIWTDLKDMPYTDASVREMQRWQTLVPLNLMRCPLADTELNGFFIPAHTQILHNLWSVHHDKEYWGEDADEFRPERFLTEDGKGVKKWDRYIPFSMGKRSCPGEPLAKVEIFLYFTSIMQKFSIRFPDGKVANFDAKVGIGLIPPPQEIILTKRS